jgi:hypothetical protein
MRHFNRKFSSFRERHHSAVEASGPEECILDPSSEPAPLGRRFLRNPLFLARLAALTLGRNCNLETAFKTRSRVSVETVPASFTTRDTVAVETPANFATSRTVVISATCHLIVSAKSQSGSISPSCSETCENIGNPGQKPDVSNGPLLKRPNCLNIPAIKIVPVCLAEMKLTRAILRIARVNFHNLYQ